MTHIIFDDDRLELEAGQTVLSALLERGYTIPHSCRSGVCQTCLMQATEGDVPESAQAGLRDTLKAQGYFLACRCEPQTPLRVTLPETTALRSTAIVTQHHRLGPDVLRLRLKPEQAFPYQAGQYITVWKDDTQGRSYSLASVPTLEDDLELHIRRIPNGTVSNWLHDSIQTGESLQLQAATGHCFYTTGAPHQPLLLAGTGTGLAPLFGIARDALHQGHQGEIHLFHGARDTEGLYLHQDLMALAKQYPNFHYHASVLQADKIQAPVSTVPLDQQIMTVVTEPADWRIYLCGDPALVNGLKRKLFLAGAAMNNIYSDPFLSPANA